MLNTVLAFNFANSFISFANFWLDTLEIIVNINNIIKIMLKTTNVNNFSLILLGFFPLTITVVLLFIVRSFNQNLHTLNSQNFNNFLLIFFILYDILKDVKRIYNSYWRI